MQDTQDASRAFDISKLNKSGSRVGPRGARLGKGPVSSAPPKPDMAKDVAQPKKKEKVGGCFGWLIGKGRCDVCSPEA